MKTIKFILHKIVVIEVMLIILFFAGNLLEVSIPVITPFISACLTYLTPVAIIALIGYIVLSLLSLKVVEIALGVVLGGIILYYIFNH